MKSSKISTQSAHNSQKSRKKKKGKQSAAHCYLRTEKLSKHYGGIQALVDGDFYIGDGECIAIMGDNGAGKSTFVRMLAGAEVPDAGRIFLKEKEIAFAQPSDARAMGIETVYQDLALADDLDVTSNIFLGRELVRLALGPFSILNHNKMQKEAVQFLAQTGVNIPDISEALRHMSGGQRQCIAISRAAAWAQDLIIMDEPTAALGVQETAKVVEIINQLRQRNIAIIIISHNLQQVFELVDAVWVFRHGKIVARRDIGDTTKDEIVSLITGALEK